MRPVEQRLGGGRYVARCRHGQKGGRGRGGWPSGPGSGLLLPQYNHGGRVSLRDAEALRQGRQRAGRGSAAGAQRRQQRGQEDVDPLIGFTLLHAEQASLHHLEGIRFEIDQDEEESIFWRWEGAVLLHTKSTSGSRLPIKAPRRHVRLERDLKGWDELLKLVKGQTGQIEELHGAGLYVGELDTDHPGCLLSWETQYTTINRDKLTYVFLSERGSPLSTRTIRHILLRAGLDAQLPFPVHPHMLRHACGFYLANKGIDTRAIQQYLGHRHIQHTVRYTELAPQRFRDFWAD